jgi:hypothetical protein
MSRHYKPTDEGKKFAALEIVAGAAYLSSECDRYRWKVRIGCFPEGLPTEKSAKDRSFFYIDLQGIEIKSEGNFPTAEAANEDFMVWYDDLFANPPELVDTDGEILQRYLF